MLGRKYVVNREEALNPEPAVGKCKKQMASLFRIFLKDSGIGCMRYQGKYRHGALDECPLESIKSPDPLLYSTQPGD